jgi:ParB-like chromosome segregation protein Spo0J
VSIAIRIDKLALDGGTQPRAEIDAAVVAEYAEAMQAGATFPPVVVYHDGTSYWLADGYHRIHAALKIGARTIWADIRQGKQRDAVWASFAANKTHGLRRKPGDARRAVEAILRDGEWAKISQVRIAEHVGVSQQFVSKLAKELADPLTTSCKSVSDNVAPLPNRTTVVGKDGRQTCVSAIGRDKADESQQAAAINPEHDALRQPLPPDNPKIAEAFRRRGELLDHAKALSAVRAACAQAKASADPLWAEIDRDQIDAELGRAITRLRDAAPYAVCPICRGIGCELCQLKGWVGKTRYKLAPEDMRK